MIAAIGVGVLCAGPPGAAGHRTGSTTHAEPAAIIANEPAVREAHALLGPAFNRSETRHFVILSDCSSSWTRARGVLLERTRDQYFRMADKLDMPVHEHEHKLLCILFDDPARYAAFARATDGLAAGWVAGYYSTASNYVVFYNDENAPDLQRALEQLDAYAEEAETRRTRARSVRDESLAGRLLASAEDLDGKVDAERDRLTQRAHDVAVAKTIHEAVHLLAFNTGLQRPDRDYPFWVSEGLATTFETSQPGSAFGPAHRSESREARLQALVDNGGVIPANRLVALTEAPGDAAIADAMYQQSYALFAHLYRHDRRALGAYLNAFHQLPAGPISQRRQLELFHTYFGDPERLQRRILRDVEH